MKGECQACGAEVEPNEYHPFAYCVLVTAGFDPVEVVAKSPQVKALEAEVERLRGIINEAVTRIDRAWGFPCGEPMAEVHSILSKALGHY